MLEAGIKGEQSVEVVYENTATAAYWKYSEHHACLH